jgi:phosphohistidine phosphatase
MPTLYLLRHAKSSWDDPSLPDHDRPLARRGERAAAAMGEHLHSEGIAPRLVLCSTALRARQTLERLLLASEVRLERGLYGASETDLLLFLRGLPADLESAMMIGHNPAMQELALTLAAEGPELSRLHSKYPTGALLTLEFEGGWDALGPHSALLVAFVRPKDLR